MKKLITLLFILLIGTMVNASIQVRPEIALGKDVNDNRALEIIPLRVSWNPVPEWYFKGGMSINYTKARSGSGAWNHYSEGIVTKVEWKPVHFIGKGSIKDLTLSFTKSFSRLYKGAANPVSYINSQPYERVGIGFMMDF